MNKLITQVALHLSLAIVFFLSSPVWAAHPNKKILETDMMDDDIEEIIHLLTDKTVRPTIKAIVVSTGNVYLKAAIARKLVSGLGASIPVYAGTSTDLSDNDVTAFAASYELEGKPLLSYEEIEAYKGYRGRNGDAALKIHQMFQDLSPNEKLDVVATTAPIGIADAIGKDLGLAKRALGDLFGMGFYKTNQAGKLVGPFNVRANPDSVVRLFDYFHKGVFENFYHVPSDTVQSRSGLPGGYLPDTGDGLVLRNRLHHGMSRHDALKLIYSAALEYGLNWRHFATQHEGIGFRDSDRWVPSSFADPDKAMGYYLADTIPAALSKLSPDQLKKEKFKPRIILAHPQAGKDPVLFREAQSNEGREIHDLSEVNGWAIAQRHIEQVEAAASDPGQRPHSDFYKPTLELPTSPKPKPKPSIEVVDKRPKAVVLTFKNSPDDWFALLRILSTARGKEALGRGGIITEGFETEAVSQAVRSVLQDLGETHIPVAAGYQYQPEEVASIANFKGEIAFYGHNQGTRAFRNLPKGEDNFQLSAQAIIDRAYHWADRHQGEVDPITLGEGIDLYRRLDKKPASLQSMGNSYIMGGGRLDKSSPKMILSRNWLPHTEEIKRGLEQMAKKPTHIFSSNEFGGSLVARTDGDIGNSAVAFGKLSQLGEKINSLKAIEKHWVNWSRVFQWVMKGQSETPFNPDSQVSLVTISPLGLTIADEWTRGELERGTSEIGSESISLEEKISGTAAQPSAPKIRWLRKDGGQEISPLARRFSDALDALVVSREANHHHHEVREFSIFDPRSRHSFLDLEAKTRSGESGHRGCDLDNL